VKYGFQFLSGETAYHSTDNTCYLSEFVALKDTLRFTGATGIQKYQLNFIVIHMNTDASHQFVFCILPCLLDILMF